MLHAVAAWAASGQRPERPVELVLACDEEQGFGGSKAQLERGVRAAGIVIGEPTDMRIVTTQLQ
jgi:acetylornithine deacetylase/succinyl-diaminopimelate desuccinylase-like protein